MPKIAVAINSIWASGDPGDMTDMKTLLGQPTSKGQMATFILYNIPNRDCGMYSSGGTTVEQYNTWFANIASVIGQAKVMIILESDAIAGSTDRNCMTQAAADQRLALIKQAVDTLRSRAPNASIYLDAGNPSWVRRSFFARFKYLDLDQK